MIQTLRLLPHILIICLLTSACSSSEGSPESCDFNEKIVAVSINEREEFLHDTERLDRQILNYQEDLLREQRQKKASQLLIESALDDDDPPFVEELSRRGSLLVARIDLLQKIKASSNRSEKKNFLHLYNELRWGDFVTSRAFLQKCSDPIVLHSDPDSTSDPDPLKSSFLQDPISANDRMYYGYASLDEVEATQDTSQTYTLIGPKSGRGFSTGFFVQHPDTQIRWKVKVGWESYRETLATHIAWALGFHAEPVFHVRAFHVEYDDELKLLFDAQGRSLGHSLSGLILKNGAIIDLIATEENPLDAAALFDEHEDQVATVIFKSVILEKRDPNIIRGGQWSFDAFRKYEWPSIRLMGLLTLWLDNPDIKFDNNRIFVQCSLAETRMEDCLEAGGSIDYRFSIHDLGLAFTEDPNDFNKTDSTHELDLKRNEDGQLEMEISTRGRDVYAWRLITLEDAEAFAERLAQLTEEHFLQAVAASGYPYPAVRLITERLKDRRNDFLELVVPGKYENFSVDLELSVAEAGGVSFTGDSEESNTQTVVIPQDGFVLENGELTNDISLNKSGQHSEMLRH